VQKSSPATGQTEPNNTREDSPPTQLKKKRWVKLRLVQPGFLTVKEVANLLGVSHRTITGDRIVKGIRF
jgi:DNA-binding NarL/FixJ family response regulator